jgi:hypothetical protein
MPAVWIDNKRVRILDNHKRWTMQQSKSVIDCRELHSDKISSYVIMGILFRTTANKKIL